jgi:hypothetical protein
MTDQPASAEPTFAVESSADLLDESVTRERAQAAINFGLTHGARSAARPAVKVSIPPARQSPADEAALLAAGQAAARSVDFS